MARKFAAIVFSLGCMHASSSMALGLGDLALESFLNEPLKAKVDLLNTGGLHEDQIRIRLATAEDFKRMGVDRAYFLTSITFDVDLDEKGGGRIVLTSEDPVLEPYLDFIVEARWPSGRLLREYTVLVDPPVFDSSTPVISARERVTATEGAPESTKKKTEAVAGTGTRVKVGKSDLGPGEMPQRGFNATTSPVPTAGNRYMIHRDDTLWEIAVSSKPAGASVHQTMLDIQRLNPDAFIDGNINRIKAGFIVYLPDEGDISSADMAVALEEVREQNKAWLAQKEAERSMGSGPSLRISADPVAPDEVEMPAAGAAMAGGAISDQAAAEDLAAAELARAELEQRLGSMEQQVETLQRIVSLKDDQIAALQNALAGGQGEDVDLEMQAAIDELEGETASGQPGSEMTDAESMMDAEGKAVIDEIEAAVEVAAAEPAPQPEVAEPEPAAKPAQPDAARSGGIMDYLWYIVGAAVLAILGLLFLRGRGKEAVEEVESVVESRDDAFADVELPDQPLEVVSEETVAEDVAAEAEPAAGGAEELEAEPDNRGYGQRKHDQYASDVEANDALAEAEIYIAYGRYPQAIDLLNNAIGNEPSNPEYRLKLMEMHLQMGDEAAATEQLNELQAINDPGTLARAQELLGGAAEQAAPAPAEPAPMELGLVDKVDKVETPLTDTPPEFEESLEDEFGGLEIEEPAAALDSDLGVEIDDDLDLSADFEDAGVEADAMEDELVIAAESNGMSTKLDLARAYLDMGDDDGARQILEEVAAEGTEELQAEARELLERIG